MLKYSAVTVNRSRRRVDSTVLNKFGGPPTSELSASLGIFGKLELFYQPLLGSFYTIVSPLHFSTVAASLYTIVTPF